MCVYRCRNMLTQCNTWLNSHCVIEPLNLLAGARGVRRSIGRYHAKKSKAGGQVKWMHRRGLDPDLSRKLPKPLLPCLSKWNCIKCDTFVSYLRNCITIKSHDPFKLNIPHTSRTQVHIPTNKQTTIRMTCAGRIYSHHLILDLEPRVMRPDCSSDQDHQQLRRPVNSLQPQTLHIWKSGGPQ